MDNVLLFSYFVFMILMPALPLLAGGDYGYSLPLGHGYFMPLFLFYNTALALVFSATIMWRRLRWVPVAGEMVGESYDLVGLRIATHAWRYEFRGLVYETEDVDPVDILNTRRHGTVWVDSNCPSRILPRAGGAASSSTSSSVPYRSTCCSRAYSCPDGRPWCQFRCPYDAALSVLGLTSALPSVPKPATSYGSPPSCRELHCKDGLERSDTPHSRPPASTPALSCALLAQVSHYRHEGDGDAHNGLSA